MNFSRLYLLACMVAATANAADRVAAGPANPIPWNQIGAKAGADYKGDGLAVTPTDIGARLHCIFQRLDGDATPEGLWLTSTASTTATDRFRVMAVGIGRNSVSKLRADSPNAVLAIPNRATFPPLPKGEGRGEGENAQQIFTDPSMWTLPQLLPESGTISLSGQTVRFTRPGVIEEYSVSMDGIRQDFIIAQPPNAATTRPTTDVVSPSPGGEGRGEGERYLKSRVHEDGRGEREHHLKTDSAIRNPQSALIVTLSVSGATVEPAPDGATLILQNSGRRIAYNRLRVTDATGKELPAHIEVCSAEDESTDSYPLSVPDPFVEISPSALANIAYGVHALACPAAGNTLKGGHQTSLAIAINDTAATYPLRIDPTFSDANWVSLGGLQGANGTVTAAALDSAGNLYIGGTFSAVGSTLASYVAKWNGTDWSPVGSGISGAYMPAGLYSPGVYALVCAGNTLYVGGDFTIAGGNRANSVAQWDGTNWSALGSGVDGIVYALTGQGSVLYAAGAFTNAGSVAANNVAQWDGTNWSALGDGISDQVRALAISGGTLYAGGSFSSAGGIVVNDIAQWDGGSWSALGSGMSNSGMGGNGYVYALAVSGGMLYAGGQFTTAGGYTANGVAQWDGTNWSALGSGLSASTSPFPVVFALLMSGNILYAGGSFSGAGGVPVANIAQWDGNSWSALGSGVGGGFLGGGVLALAVSGGTLYAGGSFTNAGATAVYRIAQWNSTNWSALAGGLSSQVNALVISSNALYAGGNFVTLGSNVVNHVAQWTGTGWSSLGFGVGGNVYALAVSGGTLYAGGAFNRPANSVARWDGTNWSALGSGMNNYVLALAVSGNMLYAGGQFTTAGGTSAAEIAQWDGTNWSALGSGMNLPVTALAVSGSTLYAGGQFTAAGGVAVNGIAQWNGSSWSALGSGLYGGADGPVSALAVAAGTLYAGGNFTYAGGNPAAHVAQWNGSGWAPLASGIGGFGPKVYALAAFGGSLYVGGSFTAAGGIFASNIAQWDGTNWSAFGSGVNGQVNALAVSTGELYAGGNFTMAGGKISAYAAEAILPVTISILTTDGNFGITNGAFGFNVSGPSGSNVIIQASADLQSWTSLQTNQLTNGLFYFSDPQPLSNSRRFYRAQLSP